MQASSLLFSGPWQAAGKMPAHQRILRSDAGLSRPDLNPGSLTPRPKGWVFGVRCRDARALGRLVHFRGQVGTKPRRIGDSAGICLRSNATQNKNRSRSRTCRIVAGAGNPRNAVPPPFTTAEGIALLTNPGCSDLFRHVRRGKRPAFARQTRPMLVSGPGRTVHPSDDPACRPVYHRLLYEFMQNYVEDYHARHYETVKA